MPEAPIPPNETQRLAALRSYDILAGERDRTLDAVCRVVASIFGSQIALVSISDTNRQVIKGGVGFAADELARELAPCAYAIQGDGPMVVEDLTRDPRFADNPLLREPYNLRFYAGAPLVTPDRHALGTLCAIDTHAIRPSAEQVSNLRDLSQAVMALFNLRKAMAGTRDLALTDTLTGVANRAALILQLQAMIERGAPFALIYLDVDDFKRVNDTRGHTAGDRVLVEIAATLQASVRGVDLPGRLGGDEFAVLVPDCDMAEAGRVASRIFAALQTVDAAADGTIGFSVGVAGFSAPPADVNDALALADRVMYAAKNTGKNQVVARSADELRALA